MMWNWRCLLLDGCYYKAKNHPLFEVWRLKREERYLVIFNQQLHEWRGFFESFFDMVFGAGYIVSSYIVSPVTVCLQPLNILSPFIMSPLHFVPRMLHNVPTSSKFVPRPYKIHPRNICLRKCVYPSRVTLCPRYNVSPARTSASLLQCAP